MDAADITSVHDYTEESVRRALTAKRKVVDRGRCLNCGEELAPTLIYCDLDCKAYHEHTERVLKRTNR